MNPTRFPHAPEVFPTQTRRYPFLELVAYLVCLLRGRSLTPVVTRIRSLPVEGPKPHIVVEPVACQGAEALYPSSLPNPSLPARGPKPCTRRRCQIRHCLPGGQSPVPVVTAKSIVACQGAETLHPSSHPLPSWLLPVRGPKPYPCRCHCCRCRCRHVRQKDYEMRPCCQAAQYRTFVGPEEPALNN